MQTETVEITTLKYDPKNARKHDKKNLEAIKGSLTRFGQQKAIVVDKNNNVIAGNGTLAGATALGWKTISVHRTELEGDEATAYALADNRSAELATWDMAVLTETLRALDIANFPIAEIGFDLGDFNLKDDKEGLTDPDSVPENVETRCKPGDLWLLGNHRLLCGDSTNVQHVERLMAGEKADMVFTDPPYGMGLKTGYKGGQVPNTKGGFTATRKSHKPVYGDDEPFDPGFLLSFFEYCDEIFLFGADYYAERIPNRIEGGMFVWDKNVVEEMDRMHNSAFELCWSKHKHKRQILRIRNGIYGPKDDSKKTVHPTQKKVQVSQWFIELYSKQNGLIIDLFLGSGSTLIACEKTNRKCYGMEIDPHYCSVILTRWEQFTGLKAELSNGTIPTGK